MNHKLVSTQTIDRLSEGFFESINTLSGNRKEATKSFFLNQQDGSTVKFLFNTLKITKAEQENPKTLSKTLHFFLFILPYQLFDGGDLNGITNASVTQLDQTQVILSGICHGESEITASAEYAKGVLALTPAVLPPENDFLVVEQGFCDRFGIQNGFEFRFSETMERFFNHLEKTGFQNIVLQDMAFSPTVSEKLSPVYEALRSFSHHTYYQRQEQVLSNFELVKPLFAVHPSHFFCFVDHMLENKLVESNLFSTAFISVFMAMGIFSIAKSKTLPNLRLITGISHFHQIGYLLANPDKLMNYSRILFKGKDPSKKIAKNSEFGLLTLQLQIEQTQRRFKTLK